MSNIPRREFLQQGLVGAGLLMTSSGCRDSSVNTTIKVINEEMKNNPVTAMRHFVASVRGAYLESNKDALSQFADLIPELPLKDFLAKSIQSNGLLSTKVPEIEKFFQTTVAYDADVKLAISSSLDPENALKMVNRLIAHHPENSTVRDTDGVITYGDRILLTIFVVSKLLDPAKLGLKYNSDKDTLDTIDTSVARREMIEALSAKV